jgi:hypothetical protein
MAQDDDIDLPSQSSGGGGPSAASIVVPLITTATALVIGLAGGAAIGWLAFSRDPEVVEVARDLTAEELTALCTPQIDAAVETAASELQVAQGRVSTLQEQVFSKEREIADMEAEMSRRAERGRALVAEIEAARAELATLRTQLTEAVAEKDRLFRQLRHTEEQLADSRVETYVAREDALSFKWTTFLGEAQLQVCEHGGRKRMGRCRETIDTVLAPLRPQFEHCVRSGQELPTLVMEENEDARLPAFARWLGQDDRITKDWYVLMCDPTLPEQEGWNPPPLPQPSTVPPDDGPIELPQ